jgi:hypothetical protein
LAATRLPERACRRSRTARWGWTSVSRSHPAASVAATTRRSSANAPPHRNGGGDERAGVKTASSVRAPASRTGSRGEKRDALAATRPTGARAKNPPSGTITRFPRHPFGTTVGSMRSPHIFEPGSETQSPSKTDQLSFGFTIGDQEDLRRFASRHQRVGRIFRLSQKSTFWDRTLLRKVQFSRGQPRTVQGWRSLPRALCSQCRIAWMSLP